MGKALAFTGHGPKGPPFGGDEMGAACIRLKALLLKEIMGRAARGYDAFYCGAARGDILFGEQVLWVKATTCPAIRLICAIPHPAQAARWSEPWRSRRARLLALADEAVLISPRYAAGCYRRRNRYMVERADALLAVYDGVGRGGVAYAVACARRRGREIVRIDPHTLERTAEAPERRERR
ncbi:MAG: DUF1273 domain-containing protein [Clostridiales bacterium]|nr:DUF1273 domain-containing protein [Clostridiales bacterium]